MTKKSPAVGRSKGNRLYVEGTDDENVVRHLLARCEPAASDFPEIQRTGGKEGMLKAMTTSIRAGTGKTVAFVLDGNDDPAGRWQAVRSRLISVKVPAPDVIPPEGFVDRSTEYRTRVGVWLMPDNQRPGALEAFLHDLIEGGLYR